jgi:hypothetical protein
LYVFPETQLLQVPAVSVVPAQLEAVHVPPIITWVQVPPSARVAVQSPVPVARIASVDASQVVSHACELHV